MIQCHIHIILDLNDEKNVGSFYDAELQKTKL